MSLITCLTCKEEKLDGDLKRKGNGSASPLCKVCFLKKKREYDKGIEAKEKRREYRERPESKEKRRVYYMKYYKKPETKKKCKEYWIERRKMPEVHDKRKECRKEYYKKPEVQEKCKEYRIAYNIAQSNNIGDAYVREVIRSKSKDVLKSKDIPPELIEIQRQSIILKRTIKQKNKEDEQHDTTTDI